MMLYFRAGYLPHGCMDATGTCPFGHRSAALARSSGVEQPLSLIELPSALGARTAPQEPRAHEADARMAEAHRLALSDLRARSARAHPEWRTGARHAGQRTRRRD